MEINLKQRRVKIIAEVHPQFFGSINELERMILMCKLGGADCVKVQLYNSQELFNNDDREFLEIKENELIQIKEICDQYRIELSASIFGLEQLNWCKKINMQTLKIASRTVEEDIKAQYGNRKIK
jgi:sialic acid synthase SpsE